MRSLIPIVITAFSLAGCQQFNPLETKIVTSKKTACATHASVTHSVAPSTSAASAASAASVAEITTMEWEKQVKAETPSGLFLQEIQSIFSLTGNFKDYQTEYEHLWNTVQPKIEKLSIIDKHLGYILRGYPQYKDVANQRKIPWWFVAIVHGLEGGYNFTTHLHNGDPLSGRTYHAPSGRPQTGTPPFTWEQSANDALSKESELSSASWQDPATVAYTFEAYNGFGYHSKGINSPYLWSFSNQYTCGKYIADNKFDSSAVSQQAGAMVILKQAISQGIVNLSDATFQPPAQIIQEYEKKYPNLPNINSGESNCAN